MTELEPKNTLEISRKRIITEGLYEKSVKWMHNVDNDGVTDKKLVDEAVDIIFELHQCYHGRTSSLYTEDKNEN